MDSLTRLQAFFRDLFQLDYADLDFGLYRIFHLKRREIETFINEQLPRMVDEAFTKAQAEDKEQVEREYEQRRQELLKALGEDALLPDGRIVPEKREQGMALPLTKAIIENYEEAWRKRQQVHITEGHKAEVFNHLVSFFKRYYEEGDFIPKRRYGAQEAYAVPYNGEEVFFYWATKEMHYVKTHERFRDYAFRVEAREFVLPFEYRLPTPEEVERYGSNSKAQEAILTEALPRILEAVPEEHLRALLTQDQRTEKDIAAGKPELPLLLKRLRHFCRRNTSDYLIHPNLKGFLTRELEFYIKDQVLHLMDLEADLEAKRRVIRTFKHLAEQVVDFLATIEDAQKRLFEKKKFILGVDYLIPIQHVPREFWPAVLANEAQVAEWRAWGMLSEENTLFTPQGEVNTAFLEAHPTLPVHTRHFDRDFVRRLLETLPFKDVDEATDGLLVHGENWQALNLLLARYQEQVRCVHIDPPYNTPGFWTK